MMRLPILALLSSAVLLCGAAPALEPVTFTDNNSTAAARLAMHHINEHHNHGYKFQLSETQGYKAEKVDEVKLIELQLNLLETRCHVVNPKHFEDCETRSEGERAVKANCTVMMTVKNGDAKVTKYECDTRQAKTNSEMAMICPDCPVLLALNTSEGLQSVNEAVRKINQNTTNKHYYILQEVGRIQAGYIPMKGMYYYVEFAIVETHCPMGSRIVPEACKPLCPERAHHALCQSTYSRDEGLVAFECEFYPPSNTTALGPGEPEPVCRHFHHGGHHRPHGPPFRVGDHGHPPHAGHERPPTDPGQRGPPPHAGHERPPTDPGQRGPPPHVQEHHPHSGNGGSHHHAGGKGTSLGQERPHPFEPFHSCHRFLTNTDLAIHPICPWPRPHHPHHHHHHHHHHHPHPHPHPKTESVLRTTHNVSSKDPQMFGL